MGKVLEKVVHQHLFNYIRDHEILSALQSVFIPGDSTVNQLVDIYNTFCKSLDEGKEVGASDSILLWFKSYLADRKQRVVLPGAVSAWKYIKAGVPQGSNLGPLLFLIYITDIVVDIHFSIRLIADDTSLIVDNPQQAANLLNADLSKIHLWASRWLVSFNPFNPSKSESMTLSRKQNKPLHPPLNMAQVNINEVTSPKHLGLIFSDDGSWHEHIDHVKAKSWFRLNIMRKLKFQLDRKSLEIIYTSFMRPLLEIFQCSLGQLHSI